MIMEILKPDHSNTIRACSLCARSLRAIAQPFLGRHISVTDQGRVRESLQLLKSSGFQHVRSLSLGITNKRMVLEEYWKDYLVILGLFAQRRNLVRLWLSEIPFFFLQPQQEKVYKDTILALSCSVSELGLYGCHFTCYEELVSFVRAFPRCDKLYIQDCVTGGQDSPENSLAVLPRHKLSITDLDLTASSTSGLLIDLSGFIKDAELDVSSLSKLTCDLRSVEGIPRIVSATSDSPIRTLQFSSTCPEGFQGPWISQFSALLSLVTSKSTVAGFITSLSRWHLQSLVIGPMYHEADFAFWEAAFKDFPKLPHLVEAKTIYHYRTSDAFNVFYWDRLTSILSNRSMFPSLETVDACPTLRSQRLAYWKFSSIQSSLRFLDPTVVVKHWGERGEVVFTPSEPF